MIVYVYIFFLPGAAGNFFSRCMSLASDRCVGQITPGSVHPYMSLKEKFQSFSYADMQPNINWIEFEQGLVHYSNLFVHHSLATQSVSLWHNHPDYGFLNRQIDGSKDQKFLFYIDPSDSFEWCVLNALKKDSFIEKKWVVQGKKMLEDPAILKINLSNIFSSQQTLINEVQQVCDVVGIHLSPSNRDKIGQLWNQWILTALMPSEFDEFKKNLGWVYG